MNYNTLIDTCSITFPVDSILSEFTDKGHADSVQSYLKLYLNGLTGLDFEEIKVSLGRGRNFFQNTASFEGGFVAWGGNNTFVNSIGETERKPEKMQVYFDAEGCFALGCAGGFEKLKGEMYRQNGRITRLDIALDFHNGEVTVDQIEWAYHEGKFTRTAKPSANRVSDLDQKTRGDTIYIGKRQNGKMFRAYEKGKQLGSIDSNWVRCEVEILGKDREISPEALTNHAEAFAQAYPYLAELCFAFDVCDAKPTHLIQNTKVKTQKQVEHLFRHASRSYGKLVTLALGSFEKYGLNQESSDRLVVGLLAQGETDGLPQSLMHRQKNLLQDCVSLHSLYSVASKFHA